MIGYCINGIYVRNARNNINALGCTIVYVQHFMIFVNCSKNNSCEDKYDLQ
jgi:hypothetical protein